MPQTQNLTLDSLKHLPRETKAEVLEILEEQQRRHKRKKLYTYYPDTGPLRRELYVKHLEFFEAGLEHRERLLLAANRVGKSEGVGGYEMVLHLLGEYPDWWTGYRFRKSVKAWAAGDTGKTVREIIQAKLLGDPGAVGTGLIPGDRIQRTTNKAGVADAIETIYVRGKYGISELVLKSYDQRREAFQGTERDVIWLDEECPLDIYAECLLRTMTTNGRIMCTFTPLMGLTDMVLQFLPGGKVPG